MSNLDRRLKTLERRRELGEAMMRAAGTPASLGGGGAPLTGEALAGRLGITGETVRRWAAQGMPSCGVHPSRPSWPLYEEGACRAWAAANQPGTVLRPPAPGDTPVSGDGGSEEETMAELRSRALRLRVAHRRAELGRQIDGLLNTADAHQAWGRHTRAVRGYCGRLPGRAAPKVLALVGRGREMQEDLERLIAEEVALALAGLDEDPLAGLLPPG